LGEILYEQSWSHYLASPRFVASDEGRAVLARKPDRIDVNVLLKYPAFRHFYRGNGGEGNGDASPKATVAASTPDAKSTPEDQIDAAYLTMQTALRADLLERILQNSPSFFETVIVNLLVAMKYGGSHQNAATQLGRTGDGGVDGVRISGIRSWISPTSALASVVITANVLIYSPVAGSSSFPKCRQCQMTCRLSWR
jgi:restriction endonuclease Mrr